MSAKIDLTPEQEIAVNSIIDFLDNGTEQCFTLKGVGGAGKTTVVREAIRDRSLVIGAAISHSAKFVLQESLGNLASCYTIAQLLGLKQTIDEETGKIRFIPNVREGIRMPLDTARVLIIDECSMIDEETFNRIMSRKNDRCKVIMLGDPFQLPPVDESSSDSITFNYTQAELLTAVRYTGPLADLGTRIRDEIFKLKSGETASMNVLNIWQMGELKHDHRTSCVNESGSGYIFLNSIEDVVRIAVKGFKEANHSEAIRLLAYKNSSVNKINEVIRAQLYCDGDENKIAELPQFVRGELIICDGGYTVDNRTVIHNNQMFQVDGMLPVEGPDGVPSISLNLSPEVHLPEGEDLQVIDWENGRYIFFARNNALKLNAKEDGRQWRQYYDFRAQWAWFDYAYGLTVHKSQGRTFNDVVVFESDIFRIKAIGLKEKLQALYVACTRAKRRVYIYNKNFRCDQSKLPEWLREELGI